VARTLQLLGARWLGSAVLLLAIIALWQVAGCVIPPQEVGLVENHLPFIDWAAASPDMELTINKPSGEVTTFSIDGAVYDVDGAIEDIETIWYWFTDDNDQPHRRNGDLSMTLDDVCGLTPDIGDAKQIFVVVAISDEVGALGFYDNPQQPVVTGEDDDGKDLPLIQHVWVATLVGECP
jgi:hypothetical protein